MKIRITGAQPTYWYANFIGKEFETVRYCEKVDGYFVWHDDEDDTYVIGDGDYEIVTTEPTPQLAGIHDSLASLAVEVTKLKSVINGLTGQLTPLQLAILNAENTPDDVKLSLIVEAGRLESERQAKLNA